GIIGREVLGIGGKRDRAEKGYREK
ncbi:MAG: hypothetical protein RLZZ338_614, partial [Cyanobacteriota bacterium]